MVIDTYNRLINYLRISVTDRCNLRCLYCMPEKGVKLISHNDILSYEEITRLINIFKKLGLTKLRITGGEPFVRKEILNLIEDIKDNDTKVNISTNLHCDSKIILKLNTLNLDGINISLDSLKSETYKHITKKGNLEIVINNIKILKIRNKKINTVILKNINDKEIFDILEFCIKNNMTLRFIEKMKWVTDGIDSVPNYEIKNSFIKKGVIEEPGSTEKNSVAVYYKIKNSDLKVGFINPVHEPFCDRCNRLRLTSDGKLKLCLFSDKTFDLKNFLRNNFSDEYIKNKILKIVSQKPKYGLINKGSSKMYKYGG